MRTRFLLATALVAAVGTTASAQAAPPKWADTISAEIDKAQIAGDAAKLDAAVALAARVATAYPNDGLILHYHGYAIYRAAIQATGQGKDATPMFLQAQGILERSVKARPLAETHSLLAAIDGQLIAKDPSRGMELGMAAQGSSTAAMMLGANNPRVWLVRGQGTMFTPPEYGGGLDAAKEQLERAIKLFATDAPKPGEPSWGKAEAYLWLGQVYAQSGDKTKAAALYKEALDIAPDYMYAKVLAAGVK